MPADSPLYHSLEIGGRSLSGNILCAPLASYSDRAFRHISVEWGADLTITEMVSSEALYRGSDRTRGILERADNEKKYAVQIFGSSPGAAAEAVRIISSYNPELIDLNCGCPVPKILKSGSGSALLEHPDRIGEMVRAMKENAGCPVTVKLRSGLRRGEPLFMKAAEAAEKAGASMLTLHPRFQKQGYGGTADWSLIAELKKSTSLPVLGSGDLLSPEDIRSMMTETGCDGVMIARGGIGNPFIFRLTRELLVEGTVRTETDIRLKMETAFHHLELAFHYNPGRAAHEMRKHLCAYTRGLPASAQLRSELVHCEDLEEYRAVFTGYLGNRPDVGV
jgi:nifR3 family TIM-barrel protein